MRTLNAAGIPQPDLNRIVRFLTFQFSHLNCLVELTSDPDPQAPNAAFMTGDAYPDGGWLRGHKERDYVRIYVPTLTRPYPVTQQNPARGSCPVMTLTSWKDELLVVWAHELQHITQYAEARAVGRSVREVTDDREEKFEVDAEQTAWGATLYASATKWKIY